MTWVEGPERADDHTLTREFRWEDGYPHFLLGAEPRYRTREGNAVPNLGDFLAVEVWYKEDARSGWLETNAWPASLLGHILELVEAAKEKWDLTPGLASASGVFGSPSALSHEAEILPERWTMIMARVSGGLVSDHLGSYRSGDLVVGPFDEGWLESEYRRVARESRRHLDPLERAFRTSLLMDLHADDDDLAERVHGTVTGAVCRAVADARPSR